MEQFRQVVATIQRYLGQLTTVHKLLIGSLAVIAAMALFLVSQYAGQASMVDFAPGASAEEQQRAAAFLSQRGIPFVVTGASVRVPSGQRDAAFAQWAQSGEMPGDKDRLFRALIEKQAWYNTRQMNDQIYNRALESELAATITNFAGVRSASVVISAPERIGLGAAVIRPTATVAVFTDNNAPLSQSTVDAIAGFVAGAKAGLDSSRVTVIDAVQNRQMRARGPEDWSASTYLEHARKVEETTREKLGELLGFIPGVMIAVTAQVDVTQLRRETVSHPKPGEGTVSLPSKEQTVQNNQTGGGPGGEPGVRSNAALDINQGPGSAGSVSTQKTEETQYENHVGLTKDSVVDPKGMPTMVAVSVNVPRGYIAALLEQANAAGGNPPAGGAAAPAEAAVTDKFEKDVKPAVMEMILPHVRAMTQAANANVDPQTLRTMLLTQVNVAMIPLDLSGGVISGGGGMVGSMLGGGGGGTSGGLSGLLGSGILDRVILVGLSLAAMGMMVMMVRKAGRKIELPTPEELVGVPPKLEARNDLIGEADESDTPMAGIEVGEDEVRSQKMLEQVGELVSTSPEQAAKLLTRWIQVEN